MDSVRKEHYQTLAYTMLRQIDYLKLKYPPTNAKGKLDRPAWQKQVKEMQKIWDELVIGKENKLTENEKTRLIELNQLSLERDEAKRRGVKFDKEDLWRSMLVQSQPNSKQI